MFYPSNIYKMVTSELYKQIIPLIEIWHNVLILNQHKPNEHRNKNSSMHSIYDIYISLTITKFLTTYMNSNYSYFTPKKYLIFSLVFI